MARQLALPVTSVIPGQGGMWESIIHARATFWWEKRRSSQWLTHLNRQRAFSATAWWPHSPRDRQQEETAGGSSRRPCLLSAKEAATAASMTALLIYGLMITHGPLTNCNAFCNYTNSTSSPPTL